MEPARKQVYISHPLEPEWTRFAAISQNSKLSDFCDVFVPTKSVIHADRIKRCDLFVADITKNSFLVGLDLGIAISNSKPILYISRCKELPFPVVSIRGVAKNLLYYSNIFQICDLVLSEIRKV